MSFNPVAAILNADKVFPEPLSLPDSLEGAEPVELAEARSRLQQLGQIARELVKLIDVELAGALQGSAFRYGQDVYRPSNGKGTAKVSDPDSWWMFIRDVLDGADDEARPRLLGTLYPASAVRLTGLKMLASIAGMEEQAVRDTFIVYDPPTSLLSVMPLSKAPKYLQDLDEGEIRPVV